MIGFLKKLFPFFSGGPERSVAISWIDGTLRAISLVAKDGMLRIDAYYEHELPAGTVINGNIVEKGFLLDALATLRKKWGLRRSHVILPEDQAYVFHTRVTRAHTEAQKRIIEDHLRAFVGTHEILQGEECSCEYDVIHHGEDVLDLHVSIIPERTLLQYQGSLSAAGIKPLAMEVGAHQVSRHCSAIHEGGVILVEFGRARTLVALSNNGRIVDREIVSVGYDNLIRVTERFLGVTRAEATHIIRDYGILQAHPEHGLLSELLLELSPITRASDRLIRLHLTEPYRPAPLRFTPENLVLYGSGANMRGLDLFLQIRTRLPVSKYSPVGIRIPTEHAIVLPADKVLAFTPLLSLAMEHIEK